MRFSSTAGSSPQQLLAEEGEVNLGVISEGGFEELEAAAGTAVVSTSPPQQMFLMALPSLTPPKPLYLSMY